MAETPVAQIVTVNLTQKTVDAHKLVMATGMTKTQVINVGSQFLSQIFTEVLLSPGPHTSQFEMPNGLKMRVTAELII